MITLAQYFGEKVHDGAQQAAAFILLEKVNALLEWARLGGYGEDIDPDTGTQISGAKGGSGDGGFRLPTSTTGAANSKHKLAHAVDVFDPHDKLDRMLDDSVLEHFGLYREHPDATPGWCHLQDMAPNSGKRTFRP